MTDRMVIDPRDMPDTELVHSRRSIDGDTAPFGYAGFVVDECTVVCHECIQPEHQDRTPIFGSSEWDYPGAFCAGCSRQLDTRVLMYDDGPGADDWNEYEQRDD